LRFKIRSTSSRLLGTCLHVAVICSFALAALPRCVRAQSQPESAGPYDNLIIRGAILIDGTGAPAKGPVDIIIKKNVIQDVLPADPIGRARLGASAREETGANTRVIDAKGMYVIPGLIDMHMHFMDSPAIPLEYQFKLLLGSGVTTVRFFNIGNRTPQQMVAMKELSAENRIIAPRMYAYPFWRDYPNDPRFLSAATAPEVVREWKKEGVDGVKMASLPGEYPDIFKAVADEVHAQHMGLAVHIAQEAVYPMNALRVAADGATTIEHHYGYAESSFTDRELQILPSSYNYSSEPDRFYETGAVWLQAELPRLHGYVIDQLLAIAAKTGFTMVPTFDVYEANRDMSRAITLPWHKDFTLPAVMANWKPSPKSHGSYFYHWTSDDEATWAQMFYRWQAFVNDYKNRGGNVAVGSDVGYIYSLWGFGTIREIALLEQAGFSPLEAIHSATEVGALALGNHRLGAVRAGYLADLDILTANPLDDIKIMYGTGATRQAADGTARQVKALKFTIRDGVVFNSQALMKDVQEIVAKAKAAQKGESQ
jgi:cytosine/adenosine deaminase-related metal-dependent hydrolase